MSAPNVTRFDLSNRGRLTITGYDQDKLDITMSGRTDVNASGKARAVTLAISGRGDEPKKKYRDQNAACRRDVLRCPGHLKQPGTEAARPTGDGVCHFLANQHG